MNREQEPGGTNPLINIYKYSEMTPLDRTRVFRRSSTDISEVKKQVAPTIEDIRTRGDAGVIDYIARFDKVNLTPKELVVSQEDIDQAYANTSPEVLSAIREQIDLSRKFHKEQFSHIEKQWEKEIAPGVRLGQKKMPIESAGLYVPGGTAPYPTVMQILAIPAKEAGVKRLVGVVSPTRKNYEVIVAAKEAGVDELYRISGVAAIAALTYGTETIKPVDKIVGPGNKFVTAAKELVFGDVGIDMPAGPSEVLIVADENANPSFCAGDILSASEHDENAAGVLVTWSKKLAEETQREIDRQAQTLTRKDILKKSLSKYSAIVLVENEDEAVKFANEYGPEHLEVMTDNAQELEKKLTSAGSIFVGKWTSKALGDYATGANHVLPTGGGTKTYSPIGVETFMKTTQVQSVTEEGLKFLAPIMEPIVGVEGLDGHWSSVKNRLE